MIDDELLAVASQLSNPSGDLGNEIALHMNEANRFITERSIDALAPQPGSFVVELGPGNGRLSRSLIEQIGSTGHYLGIEPSADMAAKAFSFLNELGGSNVDVHLGDAHSAPVSANSVDGLMAVNVLYFIDDLPGLLRHIRPWFREGARCVFGVRPEETLRFFQFDTMGFHVRAPEQITEAMLDCGFKNVSVTHHKEDDGLLGDQAFPNGTVIIAGSISN